MTTSEHGTSATPVLAALSRRVASRRLPNPAIPPLGALRERHPIVGLLPLVMLYATYGIVNFALPFARLPADLDFYVLQPMLWLVPGVFTVLMVRRDKLLRLPLNRGLVFTGLFLGAVQVAVQVIVGVLIAFGRSPYGHSLLPVLSNTLRFLAILISVELLRGYLAVELNRFNKSLALVLPTVVIALALLPFSQLGALTGGLRPTISFTGETILPALGESLLATFLALLGGPLASVAYRGMLLAFQWWAPILPNPDWIITALVDTLVPLIGLIGAYDLSLPDEMKDETAEKRGSKVQWLIVAFAALLMVWFNNGALGYHPTLLSGPSMQPTLWAGDVVIVKKVAADTVEVGDIIKFQQGERHVVHRVKELYSEGGDIFFITQGDNVNAPDSPITQEQLVGKVVLVIPKVGYLSIWLRRLIAMVTG